MKATTPRREVLRIPEVPAPFPEFAHAVKVGPWVFTSGVLASDFRTGLPADVRPSLQLPLHGEDPWIRESQWIFDQLERILLEAGSSLDLAVRVDQFPTCRGVMSPYHVVRRQRVAPPRPPSTSVGIRELAFPQCSIEVEMIALAADGGLQKEAVETSDIPQPIGGYVPAVRAGDLVFVAGQLATDYRTGIPPEAATNPIFWEDNPADRQTRYVLDNIATTLGAAGSSLANVVKARVYLADLEDLPRVERVWREYFPQDPPARTVLPGMAYSTLGAVVEINVVAVTDGGTTRKETFQATDSTPFLYESPVVRAGDLVFLSGLVAATEQGLIEEAKIDPNYLGIAPRREADHVLQAADRLLQAAGSSADSIVR
ncbi:MAG: hypothetical protein LBJ87_10920, partial [bacterium]|nr:hypothetical protein [bacterium]